MVSWLGTSRASCQCVRAVGRIYHRVGCKHSCTVRSEHFWGQYIRPNIWSYGIKIYGIRSKTAYLAQNTEYTTKFSPYAEWSNPYGACMVARDCVGDNQRTCNGVHGVRLWREQQISACRQSSARHPQHQRIVRLSITELLVLGRIFFVAS